MSDAAGPTAHRAFGNDRAMVAGVAMIPLAVHCVTRAAESMGLSPVVAAELARTLMSAAGASGMIGGQWLDLQGEGASLSTAALEEFIGPRPARSSLRLPRWAVSPLGRR